MIEKVDNKWIGDSWDELGIVIPGGKDNASHDVKIRSCPSCREQGKRRSSDFSVSIIPAEGKGKCHKCGVVYLVRKEPSKVNHQPAKTYTPPSRKNLTRLKDDGLKYFQNRMISQDAVNAFKIAQRGDDVAFPYFFKGECVNIKYKNIHEKKYMQSPNGMHVLFNYDVAITYNALIICEGEEETMCWWDAGHPYAVSVDAGAPNPNDQIEKKLECLTNCYDLLEQADVIYIAVDNDANGRRLQEEIIRRVHVEKVRLVDFGKYKDGNEFRKFEGLDALSNLLNTAKEIRMDGVFRLSDVKEKLRDMYNNGLPKGTTTYMPSIDSIWKWREGEVTLVTGYANEGKSAMFNVYLPLLKAVFDGWPIGLFVPENFPAEEFYEDVIHTYVGKTTDKDYAQYRMTPDEFERAMEFVDNHFFTVYPSETPTLEAIFERFDYLVRKHGIRVIVIDPFNMVENLYDGKKTYDLYVGEFMTKLNNFTKKRRLHGILVAHQNRPEKKNADGNWPRPDPYHVKGGGTFFDKTWNLVSVYRPYRLTDPKNALVEVTSHKLKKKKLLMADTNTADVFFNWMTNRYEDPKLGNKTPFDSEDSTPPPVLPASVPEVEDDSGDLPF